MANTFDSALVVDTLADSAITVLQNKHAAFSAFSRDFGIDTLRPRATVQVEKSGTAATGSQNPTDYSGGDSTNSNVAVTVNEEHVAFYLTNQELMKGHSIETKMENHMGALLDQLWGRVATLLDETVFTNTVVVATEAAIDADDLATGWGSIAKSAQKHCVLSGPAYARFNAQTLEQFNHQGGAYNFDGFHLETDWGDAQDANTRGFFCGPNAIACASGLPDIPEAVLQNYMADRVITDPMTGLSIRMTMWGGLDSRQVNVSLDTMFGAAVGDVSALTLYQTS